MASGKLRWHLLQGWPSAHVHNWALNPPPPDSPRDTLRPAVPGLPHFLRPLVFLEVLSAPSLRSTLPLRSVVLALLSHVTSWLM